MAQLPASFPIEFAEAIAEQEDQRDWPNHTWYGRPTGATEFGWGPGPVRPGKRTAPPSEGGVYRAMCPPVELTKSDDLSVRARQKRWKRGDPPRGYPGERIG
jgi:hypothetical protein